ncbi:uncharacterized protein MONOS_17192 [Monocercomonoides exilis]|uniref:uncharacterized protein n=1 Tax=Monocercomonoides exilis TaxID=2049356 RepID=UPI00355A63F9|nr:hypothetical protein MONOS_17192 [Monocercomonoides exilis]
MSNTAQGLSIIFLITVESTSTLFQLIRTICALEFLLGDLAVLMCVLRRQNIIMQLMNRVYRRVLADYRFILYVMPLIPHFSVDFSQIIAMLFFVVIIEKKESVLDMLKFICDPQMLIKHLKQTVLKRN